MRSIPSTLRSRRALGSLLLAVAPVAFQMMPQALGANLTWDSSGTNPAHATDGSGSWDTTAGNTKWSNGVVDSLWDNASASTAVFGNANGAAGTVTIDDPSGSVTAAGLIFNTPGSGSYTIAALGSNTLNLSGSNPSLLVNPGVTVNISAPIGGSFNNTTASTGAGLFINGGGNLTLSGSSTYSGALTISYNQTAAHAPTNVTLANGASLGSSGGNMFIGYANDTVNSNLTDTSSLILGTTATDTATLTAGTIIINYNWAQKTTSITFGSSLVVNGNDTINADNIILDAGRGGSNTKGGLAILKLGAGAVLSLNGANGAGNNVNLLDLADYNYETGGSTGTGCNANADFSLGTVNGTINTISIATGKVTGGGGTSGPSVASMSFANGNLNANLIQIGRRGSQPAVGTLNLLAGSGVLTANSIVMGGAGQNSSSGTTSAVVNVSGATLQMTGDITSGTSSSISFISATINLGGGVLDMGGHNIGSGGSPIRFNATSGTLRNVNTINDTGGVTMSGTGVLTLAGTNNYIGGTTVASGTVFANGANAMGISGPLVVNAGTLDLAGFGQSVSSISGNSASGIITSSVAGTAIVTVTNGSGSYAGAIANGGAGKIVGLSVTGGSTSFTTGTHTYSGNTTINGGAFLGIGNINSTTNVTDNGTFAANGNVGAIAVDGGGHLTPGPTVASGTTGSLHASSLTIGPGGGNLDFLASNLSSFDQLSLTGTAVLNGGLTVNINLASTAPSGTYVLLNAAGGLTLNGNTVTPNLTVGGGGTTRLSGTLSKNASQILLQVAGGAASLTWTGTADGTTWDVLNHANWTSTATAGNPNQFYQADSVTFGNTSNLTINITDAVQPTSVTFSNDASHNYTINGNGITGAGSLTVAGSGSVTLNNANTYIGSTNVNSGNLVIGGAGSIGGSTLNIASGASLNLSSGGQVNSTAINISGILNADGTVGGSTMILTSPANVTVTSNGRINTPTVTINGGSLTVQSGGNLASSTVTVANGASLTVQSGGNLAAPNLTNNGAVVFGSDQTVNTLNGTDASAAVTESGNLTVNNGGSFAGSIRDGASPAAITAAGSTLTLTGSNSFTGNINVNSGATLQLDNGSNTGTISSTPTINTSGTFIYDRADSPSFSNTLSSNGAFQQLGGGVVTLTGNNSGFSGAIQAYNGTIVQGTATALGTGGLVVGMPGTTDTPTGTIIFNGAVPASTIASLSSSSSSTTGKANVLNIPQGVVVTVSGTATVGNTGGGNTTLSAIGGGALAIGGNVTVAPTGGTATLDLSGLNVATMTGAINVGNNNGGFLILANTTVASTPPSNTINTTTLNAASPASGFQPNLPSQIVLGSGTNTIQANTINLGTVRGVASILFPAGAPPTASLIITDQGGGGAAAMNISTESGNGPATDGVSGLFLAGHQANVHLSSINMATSSSQQGPTRIQGAITFDTGTFTVDGSILMSAITSSNGITTNGTTASITLGGSTPNNTATGVFTSGGITMGQFTNTNATTIANATAVANLTINGGTANLNGSITNASTRGTTTSTINLNSGTLNMNGNSIGGNGGVNSGNGPITLNLPAAGNTATLANLGSGGINGAGLTMNGAGVLQLAGNSSYSGITTAQSGKLVTLGDSARSAIFNGNNANITGGQLVFDYSGATDTDPAVQVGTILTAGYSQSPKFSSGTLFTTNAPDATKGLGWFDNSATKQLSVRYTWYGDANVDGKVNALDFNALATNYLTNSGSQVWGNGDFNYDGQVNSLDFTLLAMNFNQALPTPAPALGTLVPEPGITGVAGLMLMALARRRRKRG